MEYFIGLLVVVVLAVNAYYMAKLLRVFKEVGKAVECLLEETDEEKRDEVIQGLVNLLQITPFSVEFKVKKKPAGIKIICEVTQEQMDMIIEEPFKQKGGRQ